MKCDQCKGACCESIIIPLFATEMAPGYQRFLDNENNRWLGYHGKEIEGKGIELECKCSKLQEDGRCGIYETRPYACSVYKPGGEDCLDTVRTRRTRDQYLRIRDESDPEELAWDMQ